MKVSQFKKIHKDVLFEIEYNDSNFITDGFSIVLNARERTRGYYNNSLTANTEDNQLTLIDRYQGKLSKIEEQAYITVLNGLPSNIKYDTLRIKFPANWNFHEYLGFYIRIYALDFDNKKTYELSNFFYDKNSLNDLLAHYTPPLLYEDRLWDNQIVLDIPSVSYLATQLTDGVATIDSINDLLTDGRGFSFTTPIFIDFHFITKVEDGIYHIDEPRSIIFPQQPELSELSLNVRESSSGDFFEIYPTFLGNIDEFNNFIHRSKEVGKIYQTEMNITLFEENMKGKNTKFLFDEDAIIWRPILRTSSNKVFIEVEMFLIDLVDGSLINRFARYGLKPDQITKYQRMPKRIDVDGAFRPKIYIKNGKNIMNKVENKKIYTMSIDSPELMIMNDISAKCPMSLNIKVPNEIDNFLSNGEMTIALSPFDNILEFTLATINSIEGYDFIDLSSYDTIKLIFKSNKQYVEYVNYNKENTDLTKGMIVFKTRQTDFNTLKKISGDNGLFYIIECSKDIKTVLYSGLFITTDMIAPITDNIEEETTEIIVPIQNTEIEDNTAVVTRRTITVPRN